MVCWPALTVVILAAAIGASLALSRRAFSLAAKAPAWMYICLSPRTATTLTCCLARSAPVGAGGGRCEGGAGGGLAATTGGSGVDVILPGGGVGMAWATTT